jgi:hypothetical protein
MLVLVRLILRSGGVVQTPQTMPHILSMEATGTAGDGTVLTGR